MQFSVSHRAAFLLGCFFACMASFCTQPAQAALSISTGKTSHMTCSNGVCQATAYDAVLNVGSLKKMLKQSDVIVESEAHTAQDIELDAALVSKGGNTLTFDAYSSLIFNKPFTVPGDGGLTINTNQGKQGGDYRFAQGAYVKFEGNNDHLVINGNTFYLVKKFEDLKHRRVAFFALANDLDLSGHIYKKTPFDHPGETLEGLGHTISNFTLTATGSGGTVAMYKIASGDITYYAIRDIALTSVNITGGDNQIIAALVGQVSNAIIENVSVTGTISGGSGSTIGGVVGTDMFGVIQNASSAATVTGGDGAKNVGGLVGYFAGECDAQCLGQLSSSFSVGPVSGGAGASVGGVIGENSGAQILNSYALGPVGGGSNSFVGGLAGTQSVDPNGDNAPPSMSTSYSTATVTGGSGATLGGVIGRDVSNATNASSYWDLDTSDISNPAQGAGNIANDPGLIGLSDAQLQSGLPSGFNPNIWVQSESINNGYPYLIANPPPQ
ncbi:MAG: hypothetical protein WDM89_15935 [Rhizomicrobium sp.]